MLIRDENAQDRTDIHSLNASAFETCAEADLVDALRVQVHPVISLVAEEADTVLGHVMFSPVSLSGHPGLKIMGLAPMAVAPQHQRQGIGTALVRAGLERCRELGFGAVVVLGHPGYYPRFGFQPAKCVGIACEYEVPEDVFMVMELQPGYLHGASGIIKFHTAFGNV